MKLTKTTGQITTRTEIRKTGNNARMLQATENTSLVGPFSVEEVHAKVGGDVKVTLSENYHSVTVGVTVIIPVPANNKGVEDGLNYCFKKANEVVNHEVKGARTALRQIASRNS